MTFVVEFRVIPYRLALREPWHSAQGIMTHREGFLVRLDSDHSVGFGDCAPLPGHGTESLAQAEATLEEVRRDFGRGMAQGLMAGLAKRRAATPAACCALETACVDLLSQDRNRPLRRFLHPKAGNRVLVSDVAGALDEGTAERVVRSLAAGFRVVKVKAGTRPWAQELEILKALPAEARLRVDANGAWTPERAAGVIADLAGLPVESLEEPCGTADLETLAALQARAPFPLAVDESLVRLGPEEVLRSRAVRRLVLKPMTLGSLGVARHLGFRAQAAGLEIEVTSSLDSAVGVLAACQVAAAIDLEGTMAHGLATSAWLAEDVGLAPAVVKGAIRLTELSGLGFSPPPSA